MTEIFNPKKREQEQAYFVPVSALNDIIDDVVEKDKLGGFKLTEPEAHEIVDSYYDTPENDLRMSTVTLRTRVIDGKTFMSFKGKEQSDKFTQDHNEWEFEWDFEVLTPEDLIEKMGLQLVQRRNTDRITRYLIDEDKDEDKRIAELNFDRSHYTVSTGEAITYILEVERQDSKKLKKIIEPLENEVPYLKDLRWPHGKFVTGKAIEFALGIKTNEDTELVSESIPYLDAMFKQLKIVT